MIAIFSPSLVFLMRLLHSIPAPLLLLGRPPRILSATHLPLPWNTSHPPSPCSPHSLLTPVLTELSHCNLPFSATCGGPRRMAQFFAPALPLGEWHKNALLHFRYRLGGDLCWTKWVLRIAPSVMSLAGLSKFALLLACLMSRNVPS